MPIFLKSYTWEQTGSYVTVSVTLPAGHNGRKAEIKVGNQLLSASFSNYLFRILLRKEIIKDESKGGFNLFRSYFANISFL